MNWTTKVIWTIVLVITFFGFSFESNDIANLTYMVMSIGIGIIMCLPKERK